MKIILRPACVDDLSVLRRWDSEPHVIASNPNDDWQWETELGRDRQWREQFIAELNGRPIGYLEIIDPALEEEHYWGDVPLNLRAVDIWIGEKDFLNQGYGTQMMTLALNRCFAPPEITAVLLDPIAENTGAHRFYRRFGFKFVEERTFGQDLCHVYQLDRADWERHPGSQPDT